MCCENMKDFKEICKSKENNLKVNFSFEDNFFVIKDLESEYKNLCLLFSFCPFCGKKIY